MCHSRKSGNPGRAGSRIKCGMTGGAGSPIRSALLSVEDDKGCVIPVKMGIQSGLDPQSEALRFRLRMTPGLSVEDDWRGWIPPLFRHSRENGNPVRIGSPILSASLSVEDDKGAFG